MENKTAARTAREWWIVDRGDLVDAFYTKEDAKWFSHRKTGMIFQVREVLNDELESLRRERDEIRASRSRVADDCDRLKAELKRSHDLLDWHSERVANAVMGKIEEKAGKASVSFEEAWSDAKENIDVNAMHPEVAARMFWDIALASAHREHADEAAKLQDAEFKRDGKLEGEPPTETALNSNERRGTD